MYLLPKDRTLLGGLDFLAGHLLVFPRQLLTFVERFERQRYEQVDG